MEWVRATLLHQLLGAVMTQSGRRMTLTDVEPRAGRGEGGGGEQDRHPRSKSYKRQGSDLRLETSQKGGQVPG